MGGPFPYWSFIAVSATLLAGAAGAFAIYYSYYWYAKRSSSSEAEQRRDQDSEGAEPAGDISPSNATEEPLEQDEGIDQYAELRGAFAVWEEHDGKKYCAQIEDATCPGTRVILKLKAGSSRRFGTWATCSIKKKNVFMDQTGLEILPNEEVLHEREEPLLQALHNKRLDIGQAQDMASVLLQQLDEVPNDPTGVTKKCHSLFDDMLKAFIGELNVPLEGRGESGAGAYISTICDHLPELLTRREKENWVKMNQQRNFLTHNSGYTAEPSAAVGWIRFLGVDVMAKLYSVTGDAVHEQLKQRLREESVLRDQDSEGAKDGGPKDPQGVEVDPRSQEQVRKRVDQADKVFKGSSISFLTTWADQRGIPTKTPDGKSKADDVLLGDYLNDVEKELFQGLSSDHGYKDLSEKLKKIENKIRVAKDPVKRGKLLQEMRPVREDWEALRDNWIRNADIHSSLKMLWFAVTTLHALRNFTSHLKDDRDAEERLEPARARHCLGTYARFFRCVVELCGLGPEWHHLTGPGDKACPNEVQRRQQELQGWAATCADLMAQQITEWDLCNLDKGSQDMLLFCPGVDDELEEGLADAAWGWMHKQKALDRKVTRRSDCSYTQIQWDEFSPRWRDILLENLNRTAKQGRGQGWQDEGWAIVLVRELVHWDQMPDWAQEEPGRFLELCGWLGNFLGVGKASSLKPAKAKTVLDEASDWWVECKENLIPEQNRRQESPGQPLAFVPPLFTTDFQHKQDYDSTDINVPRPWLIERLLRKAGGEGISQCVLLTAPAGFGKSVVMEELCWGAEGWFQPGEEGGCPGFQVVAKHFCRYNMENSLDPAVFVCCLAGMLAESLPEYGSRLRSDQDLQRKFSTEELRKEGGCLLALETALYKPLVELYGSERPSSLEAGKEALIAADALDEAALLKSDNTILGVLSKLNELLSRGKLPWLKVVCSSRKDVDVDERLEDACRLVYGRWGQNNSLHAEDKEHHNDIRRDLQAFLQLRLDGSEHLRSCLKACVDSSLGGWDATRMREYTTEKVLREFLERAGISFRWLSFALRCMDKPGHGGTDFADAEGLPPGLGLLYRERFSKEITPEKFKQLKPILEVMTVSLRGAPPLTTPALYDAVRFGGWNGSMQDLEASLEVDLGGYISNCAGVWHMDHRSVSEWLTSGTQARGYRCDKLRGTAMRTAQQIWAGPVAEGEGELERVCGALNLDIPQGPRASGSLEIDRGYLFFVLVGLHEWATEKGRGGDYKWLAGGLLSAFITSAGGGGLSRLNNTGNTDHGLAVASAVAAWLEPVQKPDGTWAFNEALQELNLLGNDIGDEGAKAIASALEPRENPDGTWAFNEALNKLVLFRNKIGAEGAKAIASALEPRKNPDGTWAFNEALKELNLEGNSIGDEGAKAIASALEPRKNPDGTWAFNMALNKLDLDWVNIGDEGARAIASALEPRENPDGTWAFNEALEELYLGSNNIGDEGAKAIASALEPRKNPDGTFAFNGALNKLVLFRNNIGDEGARAIASALEPRENPDGTWAFNGALNRLNLESNKIGDEGDKAIASALEPRKNPDGTWAFNGELKELYLGMNSIGAEGAKAIASALEPRENPDGTWAFNEALEELNLYGNNIGDEGAKAIASALEPRKNADGTWAFNGALEELNLGDTNIGAEGAKAIASALEPRENPDGTWAFNGALGCLSLDDNNIGAEGAKAIASALEPRKNPDGTWAFNEALEDLHLTCKMDVYGDTSSIWSDSSLDI